MAEKEPNYVSAVMGSQWNLAFIGLMFLLMVTINLVGFGALLLAGEVAAFLIAQMPQMQHYIRLRSKIEGQTSLKEKESEMVKTLPPQYQNDFQTVVQLCYDIEQRWKTNQTSDNNYMLKDLVDKLGSFRYEYARMLQAHYLTANRDVPRLTARLQNEIQSSEAALQNEKSPKVRDVMAQNVRILKQRLQRTTQLQDLLRLLAARLAVVKNSLSLLQDEVFTMSDPESMSSAVSNLILTLNIDDELKATYEDVLGEKGGLKAPLPAAPQQPNTTAQKQTNLRRVK